MYLSLQDESFNVFPEEAVCRSFIGFLVDPLRYWWGCFPCSVLRTNFSFIVKLIGLMLSCFKTLCSPLYSNVFASCVVLDDPTLTKAKKVSVGLIDSSWQSHDKSDGSWRSCRAIRKFSVLFQRGWNPFIIVVNAILPSLLSQFLRYNAGREKGVAIMNVPTLTSQRISLRLPFLSDMEIVVIC